MMYRRAKAWLREAVQFTTCSQTPICPFGMYTMGALIQTSHAVFGMVVALSPISAEIPNFGINTNAQTLTIYYTLHGILVLIHHTRNVHVLYSTSKSL